MWWASSPAIGISAASIMRVKRTRTGFLASESYIRIGHCWLLLMMLFTRSNWSFASAVCDVEIKCTWYSCISISSCGRFRWEKYWQMCLFHDLEQFPEVSNKSLSIRRLISNLSRSQTKQANKLSITPTKTHTQSSAPGRLPLVDNVVCNVLRVFLDLYQIPFPLCVR